MGALTCLGFVVFYMINREFELKKSLVKFHGKSRIHALHHYEVPLPQTLLFCLKALCTGLPFLFINEHILLIKNFSYY